jgi:hypothetical protein
LTVRVVLAADETKPSSLLRTASLFHVPQHLGIIALDRVVTFAGNLIQHVGIHDLNLATRVFKNACFLYSGKAEWGQSAQIASSGTIGARRCCRSPNILVLLFFLNAIESYPHFCVPLVPGKPGTAWRLRLGILRAFLDS